MSYKDREVDLEWVDRKSIPVLSFPYRYNVEARMREWFDRPAGADERLYGTAIPVRFRFECGWVCGEWCDHVHQTPRLLAIYATDGSRLYLDVHARCVVLREQLDAWRAAARQALAGEEDRTA